MKARAALTLSLSSSDGFTDGLLRTAVVSVRHSTGNWTYWSSRHRRCRYCESIGHPALAVIRQVTLNEYGDARRSDLGSLDLTIENHVSDTSGEECTPFDGIPKSVLEFEVATQAQIWGKEMPSTIIVVHLIYKVRSPPAKSAEGILCWLVQVRTAVRGSGGLS
nr:hypothetical protein CFP56_07943 [Quercus suber]